MSNAAAFKRCLPALHQMARCPDADLSYVCRKRCLEVNDVTAAMRAALEESGCDVWDMAALRLTAGKYGVTITDQGVAAPAEPSGPVRTESARKFVALSPAVLAHSTPVLTKREFVTEAVGKPARQYVAQELEKPTRHSRQKEYLEVCRLLLATPGLSEGAACKQAGIAQGVFGYFKKKNFGLGPIGRDKLREVLGMDKEPEWGPLPATHVLLNAAEIARGAKDIVTYQPETAPVSPPAAPAFNAPRVSELLTSIGLDLARLAVALKGSK